jgi:hypothetical protein
MNMNMDDRPVYLTMIYDYLEGPLPQGWNEIKSLWLDANMCFSSEVTPPRQSGSFSIESQPWTPNFEGRIISAIGHLHDGSIGIDIRTSANNSLCTSATKYAETSEYIYNGMAMGADNPAKEHISSMSGCTQKDFSITELKRDQAWMVRGYYDYDVREGNTERGKQADVSVLTEIKLVSRLTSL